MLANDYEALSRKHPTGQLTSTISEAFTTFYSSLTDSEHEIILTANADYSKYAKQQLDLVKAQIDGLTSLEKYTALLEWNQHRGKKKTFFFSRETPDYKILNNPVNALNIFLLQSCFNHLMQLAYEGKTTKSEPKFNYFGIFQLSTSFAGGFLANERNTLCIAVEEEIKKLSRQDKSLSSTKLAIEILGDFFKSTTSSQHLRVNFYFELLEKFEAIKSSNPTSIPLPLPTIPPINASRTATIIVDQTNNIKFALIDNRYKVFRNGKALLIPQHAEITNEEASKHLAQSFTASLYFFNQLASNPTPVILMKAYTPLEVPTSMLSASFASNSGQFASYFGF